MTDKVKALTAKEVVEKLYNSVKKDSLQKDRPVTQIVDSLGVRLDEFSDDLKRLSNGELARVSNHTLSNVLRSLTSLEWDRRI